MFIRKKKNRSGTTSIVVVDKSKGFYREIKTIGTSKEPEEIDLIYRQAEKWIAIHSGHKTFSRHMTKKLKKSRLQSICYPMLKTS